MRLPRLLNSATPRATNLVIVFCAIRLTCIMIFSRPMPFAPKAQKGIDKGKRSTRFWLQRCMVGWKYTWASKSTDYFVNPYSGFLILDSAHNNQLLVWYVVQGMNLRAVAIVWATDNSVHNVMIAWLFCNQILYIIFIYHFTFRF